MTDRSEKPAEHSEKPPRRWRTLVLLGEYWYSGSPWRLRFAIFHNDHWTADDQVGGSRWVIPTIGHAKAHKTPRHSPRCN